MPLPTPDPKKKFFSFPAAVLPLLEGAEVYCSVSGGIDSLALLVFLQEQRDFFSYSLRAVHFEHGFRGEESLADERFCRDFCAEHNIPFESYSLAVPQHKLPGEGDEAAARRLRLESWKHIVKDPSKSLIALAHHASDRMENVFLRLFRGANVSGLTSMRAVQPLQDLTLIRPFLDYTKKELLDFLLDRKIFSYCHDSSNDSTCYSRNFIRLQLLPAVSERFPFAPDGIRQSVRVLEEDAQCLELLAEELFSPYSEREVLPLDFLKKHHKALRIRILALFLHRNNALRSFLPDHAFIGNFESLLQRSVTGKIPLPGMEGYFLELRGGAFRVITLEKKIDSSAFILHWDVTKDTQCGRFRCEIFSPAEKEFSFSGSRLEAYFDLEKLDLPLQVRSWQAGDRMIPFGRKQSVLLKKLFADQNISGSDRNLYPVVCDKEGTILWVAALRNSSVAPVTSETKVILHLFLQEM